MSQSTSHKKSSPTENKSEEGKKDSAKREAAEKENSRLRALVTELERDVARSDIDPIIKQDLEMWLDKTQQLLDVSYELIQERYSSG